MLVEMRTIHTAAMLVAKMATETVGQWAINGFNIHCQPLCIHIGQQYWPACQPTMV